MWRHNGPVNKSAGGVTVSPASATVQTGGVQQFTATVSPSGANQAVIWSLSGTGCTGASCGTIDTTGKYTAPATTPNPPTVTVRAASVADSAKAAVAAVNVMTAVNPIPAITTISPNSADTAGAPFTLPVNGPNFLTHSVVNFAGVGRATTFVSPSQLSAAIPAAAITTARIAAVTVTNPAPSGGASNPVNFTIGRFLPRFAYVANAGSNDVSMYTINASTGALTAIAPGTIAAGRFPNAVAVDPSGRFAYVANFNFNGIATSTCRVKI